jgi:putative zinc finger/helix-turn-helix YgiT family protein
MAQPVVGERREEPWVCSVCGAKAARLSSAPIEMGFRDGDYAVEGFTYEHCDACGERVLDASQLDAIQRAGVALARADLGRLSSAEILQLRHDLRLTQAELEAQLGVGVGTVGRWERGTVLQGATADRLMRILWAHPELLPEVGFVAREGRGPYRGRRSGPSSR